MATLAQLRVRAMLSQSELAKLCGVAPHTVYFWESGRITPRLKQQRALLQSLRCTPGELFEALQETKAARERKMQEEQEDEKEQPAA